MPLFYRLEYCLERTHDVYPSIPPDAPSEEKVSVVKSLDALFSMISHADVCRLQKFGYKINIYRAPRSKMTDDEMYLISRARLEFVDNLTLLNT